MKLDFITILVFLFKLTEWVKIVTCENTIEAAAPRMYGALQIVNNNKNVMFRNFFGEKQTEIFPVKDVMMSVDGKCENMKNISDEKPLIDALLPEASYELFVYQNTEGDKNRYMFIPGKQKNFVIMKIDSNQNAIIYLNKRSNNVNDDLSKCLGLIANISKLDKKFVNFIRNKITQSKEK